jgi:hypothetical protein
MIPIILAAFAFLLFSIVPTATYLYVEGRSRRHWVDAASGRKKAPALVRLAAWSSLFVSQLALPALLIPVECGAVLFALSKLGRASLGGSAVLVLLGLSAILQVVMCVRLFPLGIRLLARDQKLATRAKSAARAIGFVNLLGLASAGLVYALMLTGMFHPIVRVTLYFGVVIPMAIFAGIGLVQALFVGQAGRIASNVK